MRRHARQQRRLAVIERELAASQPELAGKFAVFARLTAGELPAGIERIPRGRSRRPPGALALLAVTFVALLISGILLGTSAPGAATTCVTRTYGLGYITNGRVADRGDTLLCGRPGRRVQCQPRISDTKPRNC